MKKRSGIIMLLLILLSMISIGVPGAAAADDRGSGNSIKAANGVSGITILL